MACGTLTAVLEWLCAAVVIALALRALELRLQTGWLLAAMVLSGGAAAVTASSRRAPPPSSVITAGSPGFVTSSTCRSCHPSEYQSWHASYHRRMSQLPTTSNVASEQLRRGERLRVESGGRTVELFARGDELWASLPDPSITSAVPAQEYERAFQRAPQRDVRVELLTGSHQHQAFWVRGARAGELRALPAVLLVAEQQLIARRDAFLNPPHRAEAPVRWNSNCIQCHAVAGAPRHDPTSDAFTSVVAELGIACEACHGAAAEHVSEMRNPLRRYRAHLSESPAASITNPARLERERGSEVCGRCHSYFFPRHEEEWWKHGFSRSYQPGAELARSQLLLSPEVLASPSGPRLGAEADSLFYRDGTIRIGGREYNGLTRSPCFERGQGDQKLSCLSCHSMHQSEPADQLGVGMRGNAACLQCHEAQARDVSAHTRHAPGSPGSLCYNCHMPHTSYALLGAIRSHRVDSPSFDARTADRPNACSLCHLEQSEAWAASAAARWYGAGPGFTLTRRPGLERPDLPAGAVFALAGDAAVRAVTAAALGRRESDAPAPGLRHQLLDILATDDYSAVRHIAARAKRELGPATVPTPLPAATISELLELRDGRPILLAE